MSRSRCAWAEGVDSIAAAIEAAASDGAASAGAEPTTESMELLMQRLNEAEARLQALEWDRSQVFSVDEKMVDSDNGAKPSSPEPPKETEKKKDKGWYEKINLRGYTQIRINDVLDTEDGSAPANYMGDSSVGDNQGFIIRRARLVLSGDVSDYASIYLQPDFATNVPGSSDGNQFTQIRDWYADLYFDKTRINRVRVGQSKVPFGWENLQSSSNRLPLDRADPINTAVKNERDLGVFYYWTPEYAQDFYKDVMDKGLKGSGNYGVFGLGFYNGQGGSFREQNDNLHFVTRYNQPITFANGQRMELGIQGYTGRYTVLSSAISPLGVGPTARPQGTLETGDRSGIRDQRVAGTFVYYPQPIGFQSEWNFGRGPSLNDEQTEVIVRDLHGGYAMTMYRIKTSNYGEFFPFYRYQYYQGGAKAERNAPYLEVDEHELGLEWQLNKYTELVTMYTVTDRTNLRSISSADQLSYEQFQGELLRFQLQFNF